MIIEEETISPAAEDDLTILGRDTLLLYYMVSQDMLRINKGRSNQIPLIDEISEVSSYVRI